MPYADLEKRRTHSREYARRYRVANLERLRRYQREFARKWRSANHERNLETQKRARSKLGVEALRAYYKVADARRADSDKRRVSRQSYRERNSAKVRQCIRRWRQENREHVRAWWRRNAALRRHCPGTFTQAQWEMRVAFFGYRCAYCLTTLPLNRCHIDHIIPVARGGTNWSSNLAPACKSCNSRKSTKRWIPRQVICKES